MSDREIRPIEPTRPSGSHAAEGRPSPQPRRDTVRPRTEDRVDVRDPHAALLALLRERILEATRRALELPGGGPAAPAFAQDRVPGLDAFVGRVFSEQNLLASRGRPHWPWPRIQAAQERGFTEGFADTLDILEDLGELDEAAWTVLSGVLHAFYDKLMRAAQQ